MRPGRNLKRVFPRLPPALAGAAAAGALLCLCLCLAALGLYLFGCFHGFQAASLFRLLLASRALGFMAAVEGALGALLPSRLSITLMSAALGVTGLLLGFGAAFMAALV